MTSVVAGEPPKLNIFNVSTGERITPIFNPQAFRFQIQAIWSELTVPGAGYMPQQYSHTTNGTHPLDLFYTVRDDSERRQRDKDERFLLALCFPRRGAGSIPQHPPPKALISWPRHYRLLCVIRSFETTVPRFNVLMDAMEQTFTLSFQTFQLGQVFSEDVARQGLRRPSSRAVGSSGILPGDIRGLPAYLQGGQ